MLCLEGKSEKETQIKRLQFCLLYEQRKHAPRVISFRLTFATYAFVLRVVLINVGNGDVRGVRDVVGGARLASLSSGILHI